MVLVAVVDATGPGTPRRCRSGSGSRAITTPKVRVGRRRAANLVLAASRAGAVTGRSTTCARAGGDGFSWRRNSRVASIVENAGLAGNFLAERCLGVKRREMRMQYFVIVRRQ